MEEKFEIKDMLEIIYKGKEEELDEKIKKNKQRTKKRNKSGKWQKYHTDYRKRSKTTKNIWKYRRKL